MGQMMDKTKRLDHSWFFPKKLEILLKNYNPVHNSFIISVVIESNLLKPDKDTISDNPKVKIIQPDQIYLSSTNSESKKNKIILTFACRSNYKHLHVPNCPDYSIFEKLFKIQKINSSDETQNEKMKKERNLYSKNKAKQARFERYGLKLININHWIQYKDINSIFYF